MTQVGLLTAIGLIVVSVVALFDYVEYLRKDLIANEIKCPIDDRIVVPIEEENKND